MNMKTNQSDTKEIQFSQGQKKKERTTKKRKKTRTKTKHKKMIIMQMPEIDAQDWEEYGDRQIKVNVGERGGGQKEAYKE